MKASWYEAFGSAQDVLIVGEKEAPLLGEGEVRVRIHASGVNPSDVKKRAGIRGEFTEDFIIPHSDGAGIVDSVGTGVDSSWIGKRVWVYNGQFQRASGTSAEYITLPVIQVVPLAESVSFAEGACLGIPAMTAHRCVFADGDVSRQTILVTGGAGAVGNYAIQLAKWGGATVITTISSDEKAEHAKAAGADHIINYRSDNVTEKIMKITDGQGVDRLVEVDFSANLPITLNVLKTNGTITSYASMSNAEPQIPFYGLMFKNITVHLVLVYNMPQEAKQEACEGINQAIADGKLKHTVAATFPLEQISDAHLAVENAQYIGNVIVEIG